MPASFLTFFLLLQQLPLSRRPIIPSLSKGAVAYAFGVARNHPFVDGNRRTAWVLARLFLGLNGATLRFAPADAIRTMLALAAGELSEDALAEWCGEGVAVNRE